MVRSARSRLTLFTRFTAFLLAALRLAAAFALGIARFFGLVVLFLFVALRIVVPLCVVSRLLPLILLPTVPRLLFPISRLLLLAVAEEVADKFAADRAAIGKDAEGPGDEVETELMVAELYGRAGAKQPAVWAALAAAKEPKVAERLREILTEWKKDLADELKRAIKSGDVKKASPMAKKNMATKRCHTWRPDAKIRKEMI